MVLFVFPYVGFSCRTVLESADRKFALLIALTRHLRLKYKIFFLFFCFFFFFFYLLIASSNNNYYVSL